jgi:hypothetical protein
LVDALESAGYGWEVIRGRIGGPATLVAPEEAAGELVC